MDMRKDYLLDGDIKHWTKSIPKNCLNQFQKLSKSIPKIVEINSKNCLNQFKKLSKSIQKIIYYYLINERQRILQP